MLKKYHTRWEPTKVEEKELEDLIFKAFERFGKPLRAREIAKFAGIPAENRADLRRKLKELAEAGKLVKIKGAKFAPPGLLNFTVGKLCVLREGFGFVDPEGGGKGVFVAGRNMAGAMNGDKVVVEILKKDRRKEGKVVAVLERAVRKVVGKVEKSAGSCFVVPDDVRIRYNILLPQRDCEKVKNRDYVVVEIVSYPTKTKAPVGRVLEVLGKESPALDVEVVIRRFELPVEFPPEVLREADSIPETVEEGEIARRVDLREQLSFTIDGEDAKDFDDAVAVEKLKDGYRLFVHIADVSYYVREGTALDAEAYRRGTSVYFPDRCIPMLPEKLSNGVCSLKEGADRLTFTCEMLIDGTGTVRDFKIYESVIRSKARLTYRLAQRMLDGDPGAVSSYPDIAEALKVMHELAEILYAKRYKRGSLDFDLPEPVIVLNAEGEPVDIYRAVRLWSHRIIEEFMIVANETVASFMFWADYPAIYRVHEAPDPEKLAEFVRFVRSMGVKAPHFKGDIRPGMLQSILKEVEGKPEEKLVNYLMLRTMARAKYSPDNIGHFGLASSHYTHFTSPIRRYADLVLHRLVKKAIKGGFAFEEISRWESKLEKICKHITERSIRAEEAERDVVELKKLRYAGAHVGEVFEAVVTGVTDRGLYVETVEQLIPGFIHVSKMKGDYYIHMPRHYQMVGERRGEVFRMGDRLLVRLLSVDISGRKAEFEVVKNLSWSER